MARCVKNVGWVDDIVVVTVLREVCGNHGAQGNYALAVFSHIVQRADDEPGAKALTGVGVVHLGVEEYSPVAVFAVIDVADHLGIQSQLVVVNGWDVFDCWLAHVSNLPLSRPLIQLRTVTSVRQSPASLDG